MEYDEFKRRLEAEYDIPFEIESGIYEGERWVTIWPKNDETSLFEIGMIFDGLERTWKRGMLL